MNSQYRYFYAIARKDQTSRWFDQMIKVDRISREVVQQWSKPGVFLTEADFIPASSSVESGEEDNGYLISIAYNSTADTSFVLIFEAQTFELVQSYALGYAVPFHAHGISCAPGLDCWSNP